MNVKELINQLKNLPEDYMIKVPIDDMCIDDVDHLDINDNRKTVEIIPKF